MEKLADKIEVVTDVLGKVAAVGAIALVVLVATNVLLRYFFRTGSVWSQELEWHLLAPLVMLGIPYALMKGDCVRVDVLYERFSEKTQIYMDIFAALIGVTVAVLMIKYSIPYVEKSWSNGEGSPDPGGLPARYFLKAILPIGFTALFLQQSAEIMRGIARLSGGKTPDQPARSET